MAIKIRYQMPETNSSSSHSLTICKNDPNKPKCTLILERDGSVIIPDYPGDFSWGWDITVDPGIRACYTISCIIGLYSGKSLQEHKDRFEKIIMDYTGATKVKYKWEEDIKNDQTCSNATKKGAFKTYCPSVDHQSIEDMYQRISMTEDSMRDFIFSNQSILLIGGEDVPPFDIMTKEFSNINYEAKIILKTKGENGIGYDIVVPFQKWPGGSEVREKLNELSYTLFYDNDKKSFLITKGYLNRHTSSNVYTIPDICFNTKTIRYYKSKNPTSGLFSYYEVSSSDDSLIEDINDYKELEFEIKKL